METKKIEISQKTIIFTITLLLSLWFLFQVRSIIVLLFIAFILMTAVNPLVKLASKIKLPTKDSFQLGPKPSPETKSTELFVELTTPDNLVTDQPTMTLSGKTLPSTYIAILAEKGEYLIVPSDLGSFSQEVALVKGANMIKLTIYQSNGNKIEKTLDAVYTTAQL